MGAKDRLRLRRRRGGPGSGSSRPAPFSASALEHDRECRGGADSQKEGELETCHVTGEFQACKPELLGH